jgi:hypothetical protein
MIKIRVEPVEEFNSMTNEFTIRDGLEGGLFSFENTLKAISKWEAIWQKPYLNPFKETLTSEEMASYYECMCITPGFNRAYLNQPDVLSALENYVMTSHTATKANSKDSGGKIRMYTSEEIYAMMAVARIPFECDKWEINRLMALIGEVSKLNAASGEKSEQDRKKVADRIVDENRRRQERFKKEGRYI